MASMLEHIFKLFIIQSYITSALPLMSLDISFLFTPLMPRRNTFRLLLDYFAFSVSLITASATFILRAIISTEDDMHRVDDVSKLYHYAS